jgi:hypothetical protein
LEKLEKNFYTTMRSQAYLDDVTYLLFSKYNTSAGQADEWYRTCPAMHLPHASFERGH